MRAESWLPKECSHKLVSVDLMDSPAHSTSSPFEALLTRLELTSRLLAAAFSFHFIRIQSHLLSTIVTLKMDFYSQLTLRFQVNL